MPAAIRKPKQSLTTENDLETGEPDPVLDMPAERRAISGSIWMFVISSVFYFLPVANGIVAGLIGGFKIGNTRMALTAAAGVLLFTTAVSWMLFTMMPIPLMGGISNQIQIAILIALSDAGLFIGAGVGGTIAQNRIDRLNRA
jgi:hypothetical protein